jgi:hypothetical protein
LLNSELGKLPEPGTTEADRGRLQTEIDALQARRAEIAGRTDLDLDVIVAQTTALKDQVEALQAEIDGLDAGLVYGGTARDWANEPTEMRRKVLRAVFGRFEMQARAIAPINLKEAA